MKNIIKRGSTKVGGLLFVHNNIKAYTFHEWIEANYPNNAYILGNIDEFLVCNIPIVDAIAINGVYKKVEPKKLEVVDWKVPWYINHKWKVRTYKKKETPYIVFSESDQKMGKTIKVIK